VQFAIALVDVQLTILAELKLLLRAQISSCVQYPNNFPQLNAAVFAKTFALVNPHALEPQSLFCVQVPPGELLTHW
jgi:hypothetical protein